MIDSINNVTGNKDWKFKTFGMSDKEDLTSENLKANVRLSKYRDSVNEEENQQLSEEKLGEALYQEKSLDSNE